MRTQINNHSSIINNQWKGPNPSSTTQRRETSDERRIIQKEPNSTNTGNKLKEPPKVAQLNNQSSIINYQLKGEPNYNTENRKSLQILLKKNLKNSSNLQQFVSLSLRKSALFFTFSQLFIRIYKKIRPFWKFLKLTYQQNNFWHCRNSLRSYQL